MNAAAAKPLKVMNPRSPDTKYTGHEPEWKTQPISGRVSAITAAFTWYNYHYGKKEVKELIIDWLVRNNRQKDAKDFGRVPESAIQNAIGWLCRMNLRGLELTESEAETVNSAIRNHIASLKSTKEVASKSNEPEVVRPNIQDRLREKMSEAAGEIEGMYDEMIIAGGKMSADYKPVTILRGMNVAPQLVGEIATAWKQRLGELEEAIKGKDAQLVEGYGNFGKLQLKNLVKFAEQVIADCGSYVQIKKVERKPRKKKPVSPEKLTSKFKYLKEFAELKLKSEPATKLVDAQEAWLYDTKKRKLIHVVADTHLGTFTVKGSAIIGFDATNSVQKTLRKPADQLKEIIGVGAPQARKAFKDIKSTEVKFNGRGNENMVLLKVR